MFYGCVQIMCSETNKYLCKLHLSHKMEPKKQGVVPLCLLGLVFNVQCLNLDRAEHKCVFVCFYLHVLQL